MIYIENDGQAIAGTDYWESEWSARGLAMISMNAGAFRILVPDSMAPFYLSDTDRQHLYALKS